MGGVVTSWVDLSIYFLGLEVGERHFFMNKYVKLIGKNQQNTFTERMIDIFMDYLNSDQTSLFKTEWKYSKGLSPFHIRKFISFGILSPFNLLFKFSSFKECVQQMDITSFMP